jgi:hypothetical protein
MNLLMQTQAEMKQLDGEMLTEKSDPRYQQLEAMSGMMPGMPGGMGGGMGMDQGMDQGQGMEGMDQSQGEEGEEDGDEDATAQTPTTMTHGDDEGDGEEGEEEGEEEEPLDPDNLPTERVTRNVESLWRRS